MKVTKEISVEEAVNIVNGESKNYTDVPNSKQITGQRRWFTEYLKYIVHNESEKLYKICWQEGSTECQDYSDEDMFFENPVKLTEVVCVEKLMFVYEDKSE